jgi:uncharacterized RmlC-like cupin family protein
MTEIQKEKKFVVTYLSGQSVIYYASTLEEATETAEKGIAWLKVGRPHVGIKSVKEV